MQRIRSAHHSSSSRCLGVKGWRLTSAWAEMEFITEIQPSRTWLPKKLSNWAMASTSCWPKGSLQGTPSKVQLVSDLFFFTFSGSKKLLYTVHLTTASLVLGLLPANSLDKFHVSSVQNPQSSFYTGSHGLWLLLFPPSIRSSKTMYNH